MLTHHTSYRSRFLPWGLVTTLGALTLLLLGVGRLTMGDPGRHRSTESELRSTTPIDAAPGAARITSAGLAIRSGRPRCDASSFNVIPPGLRTGRTSLFSGIAGRFPASSLVSRIDPWTFRSSPPVPVSGDDSSQTSGFVWSPSSGLMPWGFWTERIPSGIGPLFRVDACLDP